MKKLLSIITLFALPFLLQAQHTFSIVAVDPNTGEIGSAGATCLDTNLLGGEEGALTISDIIPGVGAIHTQAYWDPNNQQNAQLRMLAGDSPQGIIDWLIANDVDNYPQVRQYGIVALNEGESRSAAFTGKECHNKHGHITGSNYSIQGNILSSKEVLKKMEEGFLNTKGSLADKLMAAMQGANIVGADARCRKEGVSSLSAFLRVAQPTDSDPTYGNLSLELNIGATPDGIEPIDELQKAYDRWVSQQAGK